MIVFQYDKSNFNLCKEQECVKRPSENTIATELRSRAIVFALDYKRSIAQ